MKSFQNIQIIDPNKRQKLDNTPTKITTMENEGLPQYIIFSVQNSVLVYFIKYSQYETIVIIKNIFSNIGNQDRTLKNVSLNLCTVKLITTAEIWLSLLTSPESQKAFCSVRPHRTVNNPLIWSIQTSCL